MLESRSRDGDQGAVWCEVDEMLSRASVHSATAAAADIKRARRHERSRVATIEKLVGRGPLPRPVPKLGPLEIADKSAA